MREQLSGSVQPPEIIAAAKESYDKWGYGLSSVRFICGTQEVHKKPENKISEFLDDDTIYTVHALTRIQVF